MLRTALAALVLLVASCAGGYAQFQCPPGSTPVSAGGGMMCQCPDGSYAGLYTGCPMQQIQQPLCPSGTEYCGNSNQCCNAGFYCSRYGCTPHGAIECGSHYCNPGQQCSSSGCIPAGSVDCGPYYCQSGQKCGNGWRACLAENANDCGPKYKTSCEAGRICWVAPGDLGGLKKGQLYCPTSEQATDYQRQLKELAEQKERDRLAEIARKKQEAEERRRAEIEAKAKAAEERRLAEEAAARRKAEEAARKAAEAEARRKAELEARQKAEEEKRAAAAAEAKRKADEAEAKRLEAQRKAAEAEEKRKAEEAAKQKAEDDKRAAAAAAAQRKADEAAAAKTLKEEQAAAELREQQDQKIDGQLLAIVRDSRQSPASRAIAAIALGKDPASFGIPNVARESSGPSSHPSRAEREIALLALGKTGPATIKPANSNATPASAEERLRAIANDPKESDAARKIAAIALGKDAGSNPAQQPAPSSSATQPQAAAPAETSIQQVKPPPASHAYSFATTVYGTVQVSDHGKIVATTTPELAAIQYGYKPSQLSSTAAPVSSTGQIVALNPSATVAPAPNSSSSASIQQPKQAANLWSNLQSAATSTPQMQAPGSTFSTTANPASNSSSIFKDVGRATLNSANGLAQFYQSPPAQIVLNSTAAAGGELAKTVFPNARWLTGLGWVGDVTPLATSLVTKNYGAIPGNLVEVVGGHLAASAGAGFSVSLAGTTITAAPLAGAVFVGSFEFGQAVVAPRVAPWLGNQLYNLDPAFWNNPQPPSLPTPWTPLPPPKTTSSNPFKWPGPQ